MLNYAILVGWSSGCLNGWFTDYGDQKVWTPKGRQAPTGPGRFWPPLYTGVQPFVSWKQSLPGHGVGGVPRLATTLLKHLLSFDMKRKKFLVAHSATQYISIS